MSSDLGPLRIEASQVTVGGLRLQFPFPVADARMIGDRVVVLYEYMSGPRFRQFQNVEAFSLTGERLWVAQHPTSSTADTYVEFISSVPLRLSNFAGYECELDPLTGRIRDALFTK